MCHGKTKASLFLPNKRHTTDELQANNQADEKDIIFITLGMDTWFYPYECQHWKQSEYMYPTWPTHTVHEPGTGRRSTGYMNCQR